MSDRHDEKLDQMLRSRRLEPASPDLAERILLKAQRMPQNQTITASQWIRRLFAEFHLPKPAYVFACALILGLAVGFSAPMDPTAPDDTNSVDVEGFLYTDEGLL